MDMLKKFFPYAFKVSAKDVTALVVSIIIHLVAGLVVSVVLGLLNTILGVIPLVGILVGIVCWAAGSIIDLYCLAGIVLAVLLFLDVLK